MKHKQNEPIFLINSIGNLDNSVDPEKAKAAIEAKKKENEESGEEKIDKKDDSKEKIEENYRTYWYRGLNMTKEQKFYKALQDVFIGAKIEGEGGFINLMRIKAGYYSQIEKLLKEDINKAKDYINNKDKSIK